MSRYRRIEGKVDKHAVQRLLGQYFFEGGEDEAKIVLAAFGALSENSTDRIEFSLGNLENTRLKGELKRKTKKMIIWNSYCKQRILFAEKSFGRVVNVKHIYLSKEKEAVKGKGLHLPLRIRFAGAY